MKESLKSLLEISINQLKKQKILPNDLNANIHIERTRDKQFGDYACNLAMILAKPTGIKPRDLAHELVKNIPENQLIGEITIAGPGFINFHLSSQYFQQIVTDILQQKEQYGRSNLGQGKRVHLEFVSANPTGPLHVGHGRGAAYGSVLANLLTTVGFDVHREYYVNDAGRQMDILTVSIWLRYLELLGETFSFPSNGYKGAYVREIAQKLQERYGDSLRQSTQTVFANIPPDKELESEENNQEAHMDGLIHRAKTLLDNHYSSIFNIGLNAILDDIRTDLEDFGVHFDEWFSERTLQETGAITHGIDKLKEKHHVYSHDGALWFNSTTFGDDKDRVLVRENGLTTYFASDVAYHLNKYERGFDEIIDIVGSDHHGYFPRVKAAIQAMGQDPQKFHALLVQFATLYRGSERIQMSTRSGSFVTLRELREEVGKDAARFFYVMRKSSQHMDFDLELAKSQSNENPVYYIQYAHARIASVFRQLADKKLFWKNTLSDTPLTLLHEPEEKALLVDLSRYREVLEQAALVFEPHHITTYLRDLAHDFHTYYNAHAFIVSDTALRNTRLSLIAAVQQILANGLDVLGISAPSVM